MILGVYGTSEVESRRTIVSVGNDVGLLYNRALPQFVVIDVDGGRIVIGGGGGGTDKAYSEILWSHFAPF